MNRKLGILGWVMSFLIFVALLNWGLVAWFNFNLVEWMTFGISWLAKIIYSIVAIVGIIGLFNLITKTFM